MNYLNFCRIQSNKKIDVSIEKNQFGPYWPKVRTQNLSSSSYKTSYKTLLQTLQLLKYFLMHCFEDIMISKLK